MALQHIFWPTSLPRGVQRQGYGAAIANTIDAKTVDNGVPIQNSRFDIITKDVTGVYVMSAEQLRTFNDFYDIARARSFWIPYPDKASAIFDKDLYYMARFTPQSKENLATEKQWGNTLKYELNLQLKFWIKVPGRAYGDQTTLFVRQQ